MDIFSNVYKNKRILVTGHTGFKGSWLSLWLTAMGAEVAGFSKYLPSEPCHYDVINLESHIKNYTGDIRNIDDITGVFNDFQPEVVFHLAAQSIVFTAYDDPKLTFDTNLGGTVNVLENLKNNDSIKAGIIITSDKCYENDGREEGYQEEDRLGGADPYSASKACAEVAFSSYFRSFFNKENTANIASARAGNVIGGGDWASSRVVPDCARAWSAEEELIVRKPEATRPWQHVLEPLSGYLWLGASVINSPQNCIGQSFNFGPDSSDVKSVRELVDLLAHYWGKGSWKHVPDDQNKKEATLLQLSCKKAQQYLQWKPIFNFDETVKHTALWYKHYYDDAKNIYELSMDQITDYVQKAKESSVVWAKSESSDETLEHQKEAVT